MHKYTTIKEGHISWSPPWGCTPQANTRAHPWICGTTLSKGWVHPSPSTSLSCQPWTRTCTAHSQVAAKNSLACCQCILLCSGPSPAEKGLSRTHRYQIITQQYGRNATGWQCALFFWLGRSSSWPARRNSWLRQKRWLAHTTNWDMRENSIGFFFCKY